MKIIDLLNKIANGEEFKAKLKFKLGDIIITYYGIDNYYKKPEYNIEYINKECITHDFTLGMLFNCLNDEVEILEEEKKIPDKWNDLSFTTMRKKEDSIDDDIHKLKGYIETIMRTQNEIIDYLKSKGDE